MSWLPSGSKVMGIAATIAVVGFFLPWGLVSCGTTTVATVTGLQTASGGTLQTIWGPAEWEGQPELFVTLGSALVICVVFYRDYSRGRIEKLAVVIQMALAGLGLLPLLALSAKIKDELAHQEGLVPVSLQAQYGFWATVLGLVGVLIGGFLALPDLRRHGLRTISGDARRQTEKQDRATEPLRCPGCGASLDAAARFCPRCGTQL